MPPWYHQKDALEFHPLTGERWPDLEALFGPNGAYGGCWCMWWRESRKEFGQRQGEGNRHALKEIVSSGQVPGILAYVAGRPIGWCSIAPRESYPSLNRSPVLRRLDDLPVWSIVCLFIDKDYRDQGLSESLIRAAVAYAREQGATVVEAYPTVPGSEPLPPVSSFMGLPALFKRTGFVEAARPSKRKVVMRHYVS